MTTCAFGNVVQLSQSYRWTYVPDVTPTRALRHMIEISLAIATSCRSVVLLSKELCLDIGCHATKLARTMF